MVFVSNGWRENGQAAAGKVVSPSLNPQLSLLSLMPSKRIGKQPFTVVGRAKISSLPK